MIAIRRISLTETLPVRSIALRKGQSYDKCLVPEDSNEDVFHIGGVVGENVIGTASFFAKNFAEYGANGFQLRMMGVLPEYRGQNVGRAIVEYSLAILKSDYQAVYVWCHAREVAYDFYAKLGFSFMSAEFDIAGIGTHRTMLLAL